MDVQRLKRIGGWRWTSVVLGGIAGYSYYHFIGCTNGTCPITGNPWISTIYGAVFGWLVIPQQRGSVGSADRK